MAGTRRPVIGMRKLAAPMTPPPTKAAPPLPPIVAHNIKSITALAKDHPVIKVTMINDFSLVVKSESSFHNSDVPGLESGIVKPDPTKGIRGKDLRPFNAPSAAVGSSLMGIVSPGTQSVPLTPAETQAIFSWPHLPTTMEMQRGQVAAKAAFLVKMPFLKGIVSTEAMKDKVFDPANRPAMEQMAAELKGNMQVWKQLGRIFFVDAFVGNGDRVNFAEPRIQNISNLIFQTDGTGKIARAVGLDAFDPYGADAGRLYGSMIDAWITDFGQYIKDQTRYPGLAVRWVQDLKTRWFLGRAGVDADLGATESNMLSMGMSQAYAALASRLSTDAKAGRKMPSGVMARAVYMGWVR